MHKKQLTEKSYIALKLQQAPEAEEVPSISSNCILICRRYASKYRVMLLKLILQFISSGK